MDVVMAPAEAPSLMADEPPLSPPGKRLYRIRGNHFEVDDAYDVTRRLGQGSYGCIADARDRRTGERVAVKKIKDAMEDGLDTKHILREIRLLRHFRHENVLTLLDIMTPPANGPWRDVYLVLERMDTDLHYVLHSGQAFSGPHAQWISYQLLRGVKAIHSASAIHRDLKPSNLLINKNCDLKICDFGLARGFDERRSPERRREHPDELDVEEELLPHSPLTEYVVTRWYRAPELLVQNRAYGQGVDLWSVGCIIAECLSREVLFKGNDYLVQTRLIIEALGAPSAAALERLVESPAAREYIQTVGERFPVVAPVASRMPAETAPAALDLLSRLLVFDAAERPSASQLLGHEWFHELRGLNDEPEAPRFDFDFEAEGVSAAEIRALVHEEMCHFHPEQRALRAMHVGRR